MSGKQTAASASAKEAAAKPAPEKKGHKRKWYAVTQNVEPQSLWHHETNPRAFIDSQLSFPADLEIFNKCGVALTYEAAETYALCLAELIRSAENERIQAQRQVEQAVADLGKIEEMKKA